MQSVVSMLDKHHREIIGALQAELDSKFIRQGFCPTPYPHLSFHVAEGYDLTALKPALARLTSVSNPIRIRTSGLGLFTGLAHPVVYLAVVRDLVLSEFHSRVWEEVNPTCVGGNAHYMPGNWIPHITLAQGESLTNRIPEIIDMLWTREFHWEIEIESLSLIYDDDTRQGVEMNFSLTGRHNLKA